MGDGSANRANVVRALLLVTGAVLVSAAVLYNRWTLAPLASGAFRPLTLEKIRGVQLGFAVAGALCFGGAALVRRWERAIAGLGGRFAEIAIFLIVGLLPFVLLDFGLRPFVDPLTSIFVQDAELGWRMKPGAEDEWGHVRVRVNARGLRGPVVDPSKPAGVTRVLFLGDSVTFGYGVESDDDLFVTRVGRALEASLGVPVEVVNAGVGGYSPWQERIWFEREGLGYAPDLVIVGFVLNDVTEKLGLVRYGGGGLGWQLARSAQGRLDRWASGSALITTLRRGTAAVRFGADVQLGAARREAEEVRRIALDLDDPTNVRGWKITLANLDGLLDLAVERRIPAMVVAFPYALQLEAPRRLGGPQRHLLQHLRARDTVALDLLQRFASQPSPQTLMLDASHLSVEGHALAAQAITERVLRSGLLGAGSGD